MRNLLTAVLLIAVCFLGMTVYSQSSTLKELRTEKKPEPTTSLDAQAACAKQSAIAFRDNGFISSTTEFYLNHYNSRLGRCFIVTQNTEIHGGSVSTFKNISDAFEGKLYGNYVWMNNDGKKSWEVSPSDCKVTMPSGEEKRCTSSEDFDTLANVYME